MAGRCCKSRILRDNPPRPATATIAQNHTSHREPAWPRSTI
ncbi:MAG: hypothetical protein ACOY5S_02385 [Pseudomonadota bacterium]